MFCSKCGKEISKDSVFCEFCGNKVEALSEHVNAVVEKKNENNEVKKTILNENIKQISNHLEFLGYDVNKLDLDGEKEFVAAKHSSKNNMLIWEMIPNFVLLRVTLTTEKKPTAKMDDYVNKVNKDMLISRFYYVVEDDVLSLRFEAVYVGKYSKETFGQFHEMFEVDQNKGCSMENFSKLFIA